MTTKGKGLYTITSPNMESTANKEDTVTCFRELQDHHFKAHRSFKDVCSFVHLDLGSPRQTGLVAGKTSCIMKQNLFSFSKGWACTNQVEEKTAHG
jgi:hypothetical protein